MYGAAALRPDGSRAGHGFAAMALEDTTRDGKLDASDAHWKELQLWVDANHDGKTDPGTAQLGRVRHRGADPTTNVGTQTDHGNLIGLLSTFTRSDGAQQVLADVWFAKNVAPRQNDVDLPATLGDLLIAPANSCWARGRNQCQQPMFCPSSSAIAATMATNCARRC